MTVPYFEVWAYMKSFSETESKKSKSDSTKIYEVMPLFTKQDSCSQFYSQHKTFMFIATLFHRTC